MSCPQRLAINCAKPRFAKIRAKTTTRASRSLLNLMGCWTNGFVGATWLESAKEERQGFEGAAQGLLRCQAEPALQDGGIDAAEVHRHLQVAVDEIGEARVGPVQPRPDAWAGQEDRAGRAMVGPHRSVLGDPAAELAEDQHQDAVGQPRRLQVIEERPERRRELLQQRGVVRELVAVGVIASLLEVVDAQCPARP